MTNNIGIQFAGRNPGFEALCSYCWAGANLSDRPYRSEDIFGYLVQIDSQFQTFSEVLVKVLSHGRESSAFWAVRIPVGYEIVDNAGNVVSPTAILSQIREMIMPKFYTRLDDKTFKFETGRPLDLDFAPVLRPYSLRRTWGRAICMSGSERVNLAADGLDVPRLITKLSLMPSLESAKDVAITRFPAGMNAISADIRDLDRTPEVKVRIKRRDGSLTAAQDLPAAGRDFSSAEAGFDSRAYTDVVARVVPAEVLAAFGNGKDSIALGNARLAFSPAEGFVTVEFAPQRKMRKVEISFSVDGKGVDAATEGKLLKDLRIRVAGAGEQALPGPWIKHEGEEIVNFENWASDKSSLRGAFVFKGPDYTIDSVDYQRGTLLVNFHCTKPVPPAAPAPIGKGKAAQAGAILNFDYAVKGKKRPSSVLVTLVSADNSACTEIVFNSAQVEYNNGFARGSVRLPMEPALNSQLTLGAPAMYIGNVLRESSAATPSFTASLKPISGFKRFLSLFRYQSTQYLSHGWYFTRAAVLTFAALLAILLGVFVGWYFHPQIDAVLLPAPETAIVVTTPQSVSAPAPKAETAVAVDPATQSAASSPTDSAGRTETSAPETNETSETK